MLKNFKSKYHQEERFVSPNLWDRLEQKLDEETIQIAPKKAKPSFRLIWWSAAAILILALSIFIAESNTAIKDISPKIVNDNKLESPQLEQNSTLETPEKPIENKIEKPENIQINNLVQIQNKEIKTELKSNDSYDDSSVKTIEIPEEKTIVQTTDIQQIKPPKYVDSKDLLFGLELDKTRADQQNSQKSKMGMTDLKNKRSVDDFDDRLSPKSIKIFGFTVFDKDSISKK